MSYEKKSKELDDIGGTMIILEDHLSAQPSIFNETLRKLRDQITEYLQDPMTDEEEEEEA